MTDTLPALPADARPVDELDALSPLAWPRKVLARDLEDLLGAHIKHEGQRHLHQLENKRRIEQSRRAMAILDGVQERSVAFADLYQPKPGRKGR